MHFPINNYIRTDWNASMHSCFITGWYYWFIGQEAHADICWNQAISNLEMVNIEKTISVIYSYSKVN